MSSYFCWKVTSKYLNIRYLYQKLNKNTWLDLGFSVRELFSEHLKHDGLLTFEQTKWLVWETETWWPLVTHNLWKMIFDPNIPVFFRSNSTKFVSKRQWNPPLLFGHNFVRWVAHLNLCTKSLSETGLLEISGDTWRKNCDRKDVDEWAPIYHQMSLGEITNRFST